MLFWLITIALVAAAILLALYPLSRPVASRAHASPSTMYREQLETVERELARTVPQDGADVAALEAERAEIARRLLRASRDGRDDGAETTRPALLFASAVVLVLVPAVTFGLYALYGSPGRSDQPLAAQATKPLQDRSLDQMVVMAERRLEADPNDRRGWTVLANVYGRLGRFEDRERALRNVVRLGVRTPAVLTDLVEVAARNRSNVFDADAKTLLEEALGKDPGSTKAAFYRALLAEQEGEWADAARRWAALTAVPDQPDEFRTIVTTRRDAARKRLEGSSGPDPDDIAAARDMDEEDRRSMIEGMVASLATRLRDAPGDVEGWQRLVRSYIVLGRADEAREALARGRIAASEDAGALSRFDELERMMKRGGTD